MWKTCCNIMRTYCVIWTLFILIFAYVSSNCKLDEYLPVGVGEQAVMIKKVTTEPGLTNNCYIYSSRNVIGDRNDGHTFCLPSVIVAGFPKCGSSFLFKSLSSHPIVAPTKRKELCLGGILSETWPKMINFLPNETDSQNKLVLSGCLHLGANIKAMKQLCAGNIKLLYAVRDVADMLWAAYNFWCIQGMDKDCFPGRHASSSDIRSPENFHARVREMQPMGGGVSLLSSGRCFRDELTRALQVFGANNVKVIKSEDLLQAGRKDIVLKEIIEFLGLSDAAKYPQSSVWLENQRSRLYKVNSGTSLGSRGEKQVTFGDILDNSSGNGVYEISGYRRMRDETREMVYGRWREECEWLRYHFRIQYDACK